MKVVVNALVPNHLYHVIVNGKPELDELKELTSTYQAVLDKSRNPLVHSLINMKTGQHNPHLGEVYRILTPLLSHRKMGWSVVYQLEDKMLNFMFGVISSMFKLRVRFVKDYAEALEFIQTVDTTLGHWGAEQVSEPQLVQENEVITQEAEQITVGA